jgi:Cellulase N-terminal ig-like domain
MTNTPLFTSVDEFQTAFGEWTPNVQMAQLVASGFVPVTSEAEHAETHLVGTICADLTFGAIVTFGAGGDAHLQFRISGDGRYGVSVRETGFRVYRQLHKKQWIWEPLPDGEVPITLTPDLPHTVSLTCFGPVFDVAVDGVARRVEDDTIPAGRLGLYAYRARGSQAPIEFAQIRASTESGALSNFAMLYSTVGYLTAGTKRALLRTLNPLEDGLRPEQTQFAVSTTDGRIVLAGPLRRIHDTYGMQVWEADFSSLRTPGVYVIRFNIAVDDRAHVLESSQFTIDERTLTRRLLRALTILNATARNAADEDLRRFWSSVAGRFVVGDDGALWAWNADDREGAMLERTGNGFGATLPVPEQNSGFTMAGEVTILEGCDAQLQFGITPTRRLAVTLQAGAGGHCIHGGGPGAIRLHEEGPGVPDGFHIIDARYMPPEDPFRAGMPYAIRVVVTAGDVSVYLNGIRQFTAAVQVDLAGNFGIKAWGSSARFDRVAVWRNGVALEWIEIGTNRFIDSPTVLGAGPCDGSVPGDLSTVEQPACRPLFAQRSGFHDCNNIIGESNSHGAFVAGLVHMWITRRNQLSDDDRATLRRAIITGVCYLGELYELARGTGRYKHEGLARGGASDIDDKGHFLLYLTLSGVYGDLSFATKAPDIDPTLAAVAMRRGWKGCLWLSERGLAATHRALLYNHIAVCAARDAVFAAFVASDLPASSESTVDRLNQMALQAAEEFLFSRPEGFARLEGWRTATRDTGQMIPWFEGVHAIRQRFPEQTAHWIEPLRVLARRLAHHLESKNAFHVVPQSSGGDEAQNVANWNQMETVPRGGPAIADGRSFYNSTFFATMALDMVLLGEMTSEYRVEKLAAGHLNWILGLNPGIAANKVVNASSGEGAWKAAAFVQNLDAPFARGFENFDNGVSTQKAWLWGGEDWSVHREVWWFDPLENGFKTIVNGHVLWEQQWDYYNTGEHGWISGETFMLNDGIYARALIAYEDWIAGKCERWVGLGSGFDTPVAVQNHDGRLEVIVTRSDRTMWHTWENTPGGPLTDWHVMDGFIDSPIGMLNADGRMELFGRGLDGALWHRWQVTPNGPFAEWHSLEGTIIGEPTVARNADGRMEVFSQFTDGSIHHRWQVAPNSYFDPWHSLDGTGSHPRTGTNLDGRLELFVVGPDGRVYHRWQTAPNAYFDTWNSLDGDVVQLTIARNEDGRLELFAVSSDQRIIHSWQHAPNQYFETWHSLGGYFEFVESVALADGRIELFAIGSDHAVWRNVQTIPNGPFVGWESLGSSVTRLWAGVEQDGRAVLLARQKNGELWLMRQPVIGSWLHDDN